MSIKYTTTTRRSGSYFIDHLMEFANLDASVVQNNTGLTSFVITCKPVRHAQGVTLFFKNDHRLTCSPFCPKPNTPDMFHYYGVTSTFLTFHCFSKSSTLLPPSIMVYVFENYHSFS